MKNILLLAALLPACHVSFAEYKLIKFDAIETTPPKFGSGFSAHIALEYSLFLNTDDKKYYLEITGVTSSQEKYTDLRSNKTYELRNIGSTNVVSSSEKTAYKFTFALDQWKGEETSFMLHQKKAISLQLDWATLTNEERIEKAKGMTVELTTVNIHGSLVSAIQTSIDQYNSKKDGDVKTLAPTNGRQEARRKEPFSLCRVS
jgi:hypothetical protein